MTSRRRVKDKRRVLLVRTVPRRGGTCWVDNLVDTVTAAAEAKIQAGLHCCSKCHDKKVGLAARFHKQTRGSSKDTMHVDTNECVRSEM